jgi:hypothetical protein
VFPSIVREQQIRLTRRSSNNGLGKDGPRRGERGRFGGRVGLGRDQRPGNQTGAVATKTVVLLTPEEIDEAAREPLDLRGPGH